MEKIQFAVSAKTARLIGRENISDVDSAVIELIKNSYDADATCVFVGLSMPFPSVPTQIQFELALAVFGEKGVSQLLEFYERKEKAFEKKVLNHDSELQLEKLLFSKNKIVILDNGHGMNSMTLHTAWMNIGTSDKEDQIISPKGRTKTGAKGIGRFALDKLSTQTTVYTKSANDALLKWGIDWNQFETAALIEEVSATLETPEGDFESLARRLAEKNIKSFDKYQWNTGTIIILNPMREPWSIQYFEKLNKNLKSLFPNKNDSQFDIYVYNRYFTRYSSANERFSLQDSEYDYRINASFDGIDKLGITLQRNEVDTKKQKAKFVINKVEFDIPLSDFWIRDAFKVPCYKRSDYAKTFNFSLSASALLKKSVDDINEVGPFSAEMFFLKNANSTLDVIKPIVTAKRKEILNNYSGIKLYRDGFKVRPYGEEGGAFDWLNLGVRAQKSPAAASHSGDSWRVLPYQLIGAVRISRDENPNLTDMANREGLAMNSAYAMFVSLLVKIIETFEGDRQYVYREYAQWTKQKENELSQAAELVNNLRKKQEEEKKSGFEKKEQNNSEENNSDTDYTHKEYEKAVSYLLDEKDRQQRTNQVLMIFGSAGVMTNTFSHEIGRIATNMGSRMQNLRTCVQNLIGKGGYSGDPDFNPLPLIAEAEKTDQLLESWINVIMEGIKKDKFIKSPVHPQKIIQEIINLWIPLLEKKFIYILPPEYHDMQEDSTLNMAEVDFHIIMNNFFLNSAWFLEEAKAIRREISIAVYDKDAKITILLENNGPPLDSSFSNNPESIFDAGVSIKDPNSNEGTGLGLWITKAIVENNSGEIHPMIKNDGFGLKISLPK